MIDKKVLNGVLAVLSILILIIPIAMAGYMQEKTISNVISVQGTYGIGDTFGLYSGSQNMSELFSEYTPANAYDQQIGFDANNDTIFYGYKSSGSINLRDGMYLGNYNTYIGAGEHTIAPVWADFPQITYDSLRQIYIPLNITTSELSEYDFIRIHTDMDKTNNADVRLYFEESNTGLLQINPLPIDNETDLFVLDVPYKNWLNWYPNGTVYLVFTGTGDNFVETQTSFNWMVEGNILNPTDYAFGSEFTDTTIWMLIMTGLIGFYTFVLVFANPVIDIKIDNKKNRWRK